MLKSTFKKISKLYDFKACSDFCFFGARYRTKVENNLSKKIIYDIKISVLKHEFRNH